MKWKQRLIRGAWLLWAVISAVSIYGLYVGVGGNVSLLVHPRLLLNTLSQQETSHK